MVALVGQTVTIVNNSGKIVKTSKHLVGVFNEAKSAYAEKKAEIKALRRAKADQQERTTRDRLVDLHIDDDDDGAFPRSSARRRSGDGSRIKHKPVPVERPPVERGYTDSFYTNDARPRQGGSRSPQASPVRFDRDFEFQADPRAGELVRRHTDGLEQRSSRQLTPRRVASVDDVDMDLAYGELPPPLPERPSENENELRDKVTALQRMLDEANCLQHSATAIIENLSKNPDTMAAVALTLAEISNLAAKLAPGALTSLKTAFPAVIALLASPEFAIAVGVGVGVTVIAFGSYKIIKKIKQKKERADPLLGVDVAPGRGAESPVEEGVEELRELSRVELWRRGVAGSVVDGSGASVEGEFITPAATRTLLEEGRLKESDLKSVDSYKSEKQHRTHKHQRSKSAKTHRNSPQSEAGSKTKSEKEKSDKKKKEPSGLRMLFKGSS